MSNPTLDDIKHEISEMESLMCKLAEYGAADSEPDGVFQYLLAKAADGEDVEPPSNARGWQLYSSMKGSEEAARRLAAKARGVVELIRGLPVGQSKPLREYLAGYCWRCAFNA